MATGLNTHRTICTHLERSRFLFNCQYRLRSMSSQITKTLFWWRGVLERPNHWPNSKIWTGGVMSRCRAKNGWVARYTLLICKMLGVGKIRVFQVANVQHDRKVKRSLCSYIGYVNFNQWDGFRFMCIVHTNGFHLLPLLAMPLDRRTSQWRIRWFGVLETSGACSSYNHYCRDIRSYVP